MKLNDLQTDADFAEIQDVLNKNRIALLAMRRSSKNSYSKFVNATKWTKKSNIIESKLIETDGRISRIISLLRNNSPLAYEQHVVIDMEDYSVSYRTRRLTGTCLLRLLKFIIMACVMCLTGVMIGTSWK